MRPSALTALALAGLACASGIADGAPVGAAPAAITGGPPHRGEADSDVAPAPRPDPAAREVIDANFDLPARRTGYVVGFALGPALQLSSGIGEASGFAGAASLRFGINASPTLVWLLQLDASGYGAEQEMTGEVKLNNNAALTVAGQLYVREVLWLKAGVGVATFTRRADRGGAPLEELSGGGGMGSIGLALWRRGRFVLGLEGTGFVGVYRDGVIVSSGMLLGFDFY